MGFDIGKKSLKLEDIAGQEVVFARDWISGIPEGTKAVVVRAPDIRFKIDVEGNVHLPLSYELRVLVRIPSQDNKEVETRIGVLQFTEVWNAREKEALAEFEKILDEIDEEEN